MPASTVLEDRTEVPRFELVIDPNAAKDVERYSDSRNRSRSTTVPITVTTTNDALEWGRRAFSSDEDALDPHPTSFVRWIQRAVHLHLHRTPQERAEVLAEAKRVWNRPESRERKRSYNVPMPYDLNMLLEAAIPQERKAGRRTSKSGLVRDAMFIEVVAAADRAGGELPHLEGKLPHAR